MTGGPTIKQQAQEILSGDSVISETDRKFLEFVAGADFADRAGVLHVNPDGTYAPMNIERDPVDAESSSGPVQVKPGYKFREDDISIEIDDVGRIANGSMTHKQMLLLKKRMPNAFRNFVVRQWYETNDPYWVV